MSTWADVYVQLGITKYDAAFWRRLNRAVSRPSLPPTEERLPARMSQKRFVMGVIAWSSNQLENAGWDRWDLHTEALLEAYETGQRRQPFNMYHFFKWHRAILPFGGSLRQSMPVSTGMGESFQPEPVASLARVINRFVTGWIQDLDEQHPLDSLAGLHFRQWQLHPFPDGNKRHCRLLTTFGCGWFGLDPVCITLAHKVIYLDALCNADVSALAALFQSCQIQL